MATSIFYPSATKGAFYQSGDTNGTAARSLARELTQAATVSERVFNNGSASTTMTSGTLTNTPTSGDVLIAVLYRRADGQATITNPTGWTRLTTGGTAGSRLLEVWWYRSTGVVGDKGSFSWTVTSATGAWGIDLFRFGGSAAFADPTLKTAATAFTATTAPAAVTETPATTVEAPGMTLTCIAVTGASLGASGITAAFSGTGTAESSTNYYDSTFGGGASTVHDLYNNASYGSATFGTAYTLGASRAGHQAVIHLDAGGQSGSTLDGLGAGINANLASTNYPGALLQSYMVYDTSSIPDSNTVSSATLGLRALASGVAGVWATTDPANATLQARYYGTSITDTRGNNNNHWALSPSGMAAKTLVATYPAASAWTAGTDYTLTSTGSFPGSINKTGNTVLVFTTDDYATSTARATRETYGFDTSSTLAPLTVVHTLQATATVTVTVPLIITTSRIQTALRTVASTIVANTTVSGIFSALRTITTTSPLSVTVARAFTGARTITSTVPELVTVTRQQTANRTVTATTSFLTSVSRLAANIRTITTSAIASASVTVGRTVTRLITTTVNLVASVSYVRVIAQAPRILRLAMRSTITLGQTVTARLRGRSTIRLPKETR